jgi:predicted O-methyltransferase YrrM
MSYTDINDFLGKEINNYIISKGVTDLEGYSAQEPKEVADLVSIVRTDFVKDVMEIGFNSGHSAYIFLKANPNVHVTSFDIGVHDYVKYAKDIIDTLFPGRHTLILGDSLETIPKFADENPDKKFNLLFIDGYHYGEHPSRDLQNCRRIAAEKHIVAIDDTVYHSGWEASYTIDPTKAWIDAVDKDFITEIRRQSYRHGRGLSWGSYVSTTI